MFSHDPLTEETRELLDKVMPGLTGTGTARGLASMQDQDASCVTWSWDVFRREWGRYALQGGWGRSRVCLLSAQGGVHWGVAP